MIPVLHKIIRVFFILYVACAAQNTLYAQDIDNDSAYSIFFGWNTAGSAETLARYATALDTLKTSQSIALHFGSLLGPTRIVNHDKGSYYLTQARIAGIDYIFPAAGEFMFGLDAFRSFADKDSFPQFVSANIVDERTRRTLVDPYFIWDVSGLRICVIALSDMNTLRDASDENVRGIDVDSYSEALNDIYNRVMMEYPDLVIAAGRLDRESIMELVVQYPFIDIYLTNNRTGGFSDTDVITNVMSVAGKTVYIGSDSGNHIAVLNVKNVEEPGFWEFADITLGEEYPPDTEISARSNEILTLLRKKDYEDSLAASTGNAVASVIRDVYKVDAVLLERQSLFYYPLDDSLTVLNIRKIVKERNELVSYSLKGDLLRSVWEQNSEAAGTDSMLVFSGITVDGKVDSIPIQDDRDYTIVTTRFLRDGGSGYEQFTSGFSEVITDVDMLETVESFLVAKEERIRKAVKEKIWELNLYLTLSSNFNRSYVNKYKDLYGKKITKPFLEMKNEYSGNFLISSQNNRLTRQKTVGKNRFESYLKFSYTRQGTKSEESEKIQYTKQRNNDPVELYNKYTYLLPNFPVEPYIDFSVNSVLYSGYGKHPISAIISTGATRTFIRLWDLNVAIGVQGTRDYFEVQNSFGTKSSITLNKKIQGKSFFSQEIAINTKTNIFWNPAAVYNMEFKLDSDNSIHIQIWKKINATLTFRAYSYRSTIHRKLALGYFYLFTIDYGMNWKF